ncbi:hypothetical protein C0Q70_06507 [Pomacea canaliculata]|uniref:Uncharacterized protein n=1 Tax=Pomacea canaliculata TaxID=400727 RepID=A0A2T7PP65_POMCA|nr:hypothetical protein C0Q70_06507 [Pomacea canaliculata]
MKRKNLKQAVFPRLGIISSQRAFPTLDKTPYRALTEVPSAKLIINQLAVNGGKMESRQDLLAQSAPSHSASQRCS